MSDQHLRSQMIRLAASMSKGSGERKALLSVLAEEIPRKASRRPLLKRRAPDGYYQVVLKRSEEIDGGIPYILDYPSIQVALRHAKEDEKLDGVVSIEIYDSLGNFFATMVNGRLVS